MFEYDTLTIIIAASVIAIAIIGALVNPFVRGVDTCDDDEDTDGGAEKQPLPPISVLITAHDNRQQLKEHLDSFLTQDYPDFQVVVVYEEGETETEDFLKQKATMHSNLYFTFSPDSSRYMSKKKLKITLGVKAAKNEWVLLTEPTCHPDSDQWLRTMARNCTESTDIIMGYVHYDEDCSSFYRFDHLRKAFYLLRRAEHKAALATNMPNIVFRKSQFLKNNGFVGSLQFVGGEYNFLANKYSDDTNTVVELSPKAWLTEETPSAREWHSRIMFDYNTRPHLSGNASMTALRWADRILPHLAVITSIGAGAYGLLGNRLTIAAAGAAALLLLFIVRMAVAHHAMNKFQEDIAMIKLPFYEWSLVWRSMIGKFRYITSNKADFTTHKL